MKNNKKIIQNRILEIIELPDYGIINMNPLYYYGTSRNPLLFDGLFTAIEFLDFLSDRFNWVEYYLEDSVVIKERDLIKVKVILSDIRITEIVELYIDITHYCDLPIIPEFLYDLKLSDFQLAQEEKDTI